MVPLASTAEQEFDEDSFHRYLMDICQQHYNQQRALSFAFIVYDFQSPATRRVIDDLHYWQALHDLSGKYLSIFYLNAKTEPEMVPGLMYNMLSLMTSNPLGKMNQILRNNFSITEELKSPFVIFFQVENAEISNSFIVSLKQERMEDSFIELRDHIRNAVESIKNVESEYYGNTNEIYSLIENGVKNGRINKFIKTKVLGAISIGSIISLAKTIIKS